MNRYPYENPEDVFRGLDLWMVNDLLEDEEIVHQVEEFRAKGLYSVIFRTYNGLKSDYPGPQFKHKVRVAIEAAKKCGLKIVLQAGYMPSAYPNFPEEYCLCKIVPMPENEVAEGDEVLARHNGLAFVSKRAAAAVNMLDGPSTDYYIRTAYDETWEAFTEEFGKTVISVWVDEPRFNNTFLVWTPDFDEIFRERYGYSIRENLPLLYFDEGDYKKIRYDFFTLLRDRMQSCYYTKIQEWCHSHNLTFSGHLMGEERLTMQVAQAVAVMPFYKYFDIPGIDYLRTVNDWYDKPLGAEPVWDDFLQRSLHIGAVQCVSAAEQAGRKHVLCEMYGVTAPNLTFRDQMNLFDFFAANGINHQCMHALFYSIGGFRKRFYPQQFNVYQPFWENFRNVKDYVARTSSFVTTGACTKDIMVLHPLETAYGLYCGMWNPEDFSIRKNVDDYDEKFYRLVADLYGAQIPFHFGDMSTINQMGRVEDGKFIIGEMAYKTVALADIEVLDQKTLDLLCEFAAQGGKIYVKGGLPTRLDGRLDSRPSELLLAQPGVELVEDNETLLRALREVEKDYAYKCVGDAARVIINHRIDGDEHFFMIHNGDCRRGKKGELTLKGCHKAFLYNAETGATEPLDAYQRGEETVIRVETAPGAASLVRTCPCAELPAKAKRAAAYTTLPLEDVNCEIPGPNVLTLELAAYKTDDMTEFSEKEYAVERITEKFKQMNYEGNVTLRFRFDADRPVTGLKLVLEEPEEYKLKYNGQDVEIKDEGFYFANSFRITSLPDLCVPGVNYIELTRYTTPPVRAKICDSMVHLLELFRAPVGVDLERIHLLGDFGVDVLPEYTGNGLVRYSKRFVMTERKPITMEGDVTAQGYPFHPGYMEYTICAELTAELLSAETVCLHTGAYSGCSAAVWVNGEKVGSIDRDPFMLPVKSALREGENEIRVRLYGTLRNMIGPNHIRSTDHAGCSRDTWLVEMECAEQTDYDTGKYTNSFELVPFGLSNFSLVFGK